MSLFSRFFRKAPSRSTPPPPSSPNPLSAPPGRATAKPGSAERAQAVAAEEQALRSALDARDVETVARLVVAGSSTQVRQAAAQAIDDPELLRKLLRELRGGKDNNVYRILAAKRDAQLAEIRRLEQVRTEIGAVSEALERHSRRPHEPSYASDLEQLESRWTAVAGQADAALQDQARQWIDRARETVAEHQRKRAAQADQVRAAAEAAAEAERQRERQAQESAAAGAEQARRLEEQQHALAGQQQAEKQAFQQIADLIRKARAALGDGGTSRAAGLRRTLEEKLAGAPQLPPPLLTQLQQLDRQLEELKDWKSFSVAPKRIELIEAMESLIDAPLEPPVLAERIKNLQEEWRTLSKGAGENADADWQRFHDASQQAYQPCSAYFAAQAQVRADNLQRREALLARLTAFEAGTDWERADWQAVIRVLRETKQEWRDCAPVDHQAARPQQAAFTARVTGLQDRIDAEHARNRAQKESLIERARQLLDGTDGRKAIDGTKELQRQWQSVGPVPRELDQRLWSEFRRHCDAVFQKRDQESAAHAAGLEGNKAQAVALCEQIENIAALEGTELLAQAATLGDLRTAFEALGELPRADTRALRGRFEQALERCKASVARQHARDAERSWDDLFEAADRVRAYRLATARGMDVAQRDTLKTAAETFLASVPQWPRGGLDALRQSLADEGATDTTANEAALRLLCIRAEILADLPTPPEDQPLRREYQLQRLVKAMGQREQADGMCPDAMTLEWVQAGPVEDGAYHALRERFRRCRDKLVTGGGGRR